MFGFVSCAVYSSFINKQIISSYEKLRRSHKLGRVAQEEKSPTNSSTGLCFWGKHYESWVQSKVRFQFYYDDDIVLFFCMNSFHVEAFYHIFIVWIVSSEQSVSSNIRGT